MSPRLVALAALFVLIAHAAPAWSAAPVPEDEEDDEEEEAVEASSPPVMVPPSAEVPAGSPSSPAKAASAAGDGRPETSVSLSLSYYAMHYTDFLTPVVALDRDALHLEARYNYEARNTGSVFVGWTFAGGDALAFSLTPILGVVYGDQSGVSTGLEASVTWKQFDFYSESEYFIDHANYHNNYFSAWNEIGWRPVEPLRLAIVTQRTRTVDDGKDVQRGLLIQWTLKRGATLGINFFNPNSWRAYTIASLAVQY